MGNGAKRDFFLADYSSLCQKRFNPAQPTAIVTMGEICFRIYSFNRMPEPVGVRPGPRRRRSTNHGKHFSLPAIMEHRFGT